MTRGQCARSRYRPFFGVATECQDKGSESSSGACLVSNRFKPVYLSSCGFEPLFRPCASIPGLRPGFKPKFRVVCNLAQPRIRPAELVTRPGQPAGSEAPVRNLASDQRHRGARLRTHPHLALGDASAESRSSSPAPPPRPLKYREPLRVSTAWQLLGTRRPPGVAVVVVESSPLFHGGYLRSGPRAAQSQQIPWLHTCYCMYSCAHAVLSPISVSPGELHGCRPE